jgi:hypothetical protein
MLVAADVGAAGRSSNHKLVVAMPELYSRAEQPLLLGPLPSLARRHVQSLAWEPWTGR